MAKHCCEEKKYLDKQGLLYLLQVLQKGIDTQITNKIVDKAITDAELERRVVEMAQNNTLVTENELATAITQINNTILEAKTAIKTEVRGETVTIAEATANSAVSADVNAKIAAEVASAISANGILKKTQADGLYVKKTGDTVTGGLKATTLESDGLVVNGTVKVQGENGKFVTKSGIVFY